MSVDYRTLTGMNPRAFSDSSKDLSAAVTRLATEYRQYKTQVVRPLRARRSWSGGGQPDAAAVTQVNGLAIDTMRLRLAAGAVAYVYAYVGFTLAQQRLAAVCRSIEHDSLTVDADGNVVAPTVPVGDDNGPGSTSAKVQAYQGRIGKVLRFATTIDGNAARTLNTSHEPPVTALTNRPGLLEEARQDHANATIDAMSITNTLQELPHTAAEHLPTESGDLPVPSVGVPPGSTATTAIGAILLAAGLGAIEAGAGGGLALAGVTGGASVAGGATVAAGGAVVAVVGGILVVVGGTSLAATTISLTSGRPGEPPKDLDGLLQQAKKAESQSRPDYQPRTKISSSIKDDPLLTRNAERAGKNQTVQRDLNLMTERLAQGNMNPGTETRSLKGTDVYYGRTRSGARLFFRNTADGIEIVGKASKANEDPVIARLEELYGR